MARILFITTKQPSTNPRMRKSADALADAGYEVNVLYAFNAIWADDADLPIFQDAKWTRELVGGHPIKQKGTYFISRLVRKIDEWRGYVEGALCRSKNSYIRLGVKWKPDLVIGHNPGALAPAVEISRRLKIPVVFDAEDFHRGESYWVRMQKISGIVDLEDRYIPQLSGMTTAAPHISEAYKHLYPRIPISTVNNAFPSSKNTHRPKPHEGPLKVVWFSQNVGLDRGLQEFINGMNAVSAVPIELSILGNIEPNVRGMLEEMVRSSAQGISFYATRSQEHLFNFLADHEIGLALEKPLAYNREICRTNKLYTYPLTGCYMFASSTKSQNQFIEEFPQTGKIVQLDDPQSIANALTGAYENREELLKSREAAWELGQAVLNWETESYQLLNAINQTLG